MLLFGLSSDYLIDFKNEDYKTIDEFVNDINSFTDIFIKMFSDDKTPTDEEIEKLLLAIKNHKNLNKITLYGIKLNDKQSDLLKDALSENKNLEELNLHKCEIHNNFYNYFASASKNNLKEINFSKKGIDGNALYYIGKFIEKSTSLTKFDISTYNISDDAALNFANSLKVNKSLKDLRIKNSFSAIGFGHIAEALKSTNITYLNISGKLVKPDVIREIASKIEGNKLQMLMINDFVFDADAALNVAKIIESSCNLKSISLYNCDVSDNNVKVIFEAVNKSNLEKISLNSCKLTNLGAAEIASVITNNKSLKSLDLSNNNIGDDGLKTLLTAINTTNIKKIRFVRTKITDEGAKTIAKFLESNNTVIDMDLMSNGITDDGAKEIAKTLEKNKNIEFMYLPRRIGKELKDTIESICSNNRSAKLTFYQPSKNDLDGSSKKTDNFSKFQTYALLIMLPVILCVWVAPYSVVFGYVGIVLLASVAIGQIGFLVELFADMLLPTSPKTKQVPANAKAEEKSPAQEKSFRKDAEQSAKTEIALV